MPSSSALCSVSVDFPLGGIMSQIFDSTEEILTGQAPFVIVQRTFYPLHVRYIFVLSVIHLLLIWQSLLVDRSLSATCPLHMHYSCVLCAPYTFRKATETTYITR